MYLLTIFSPFFGFCLLSFGGSFLSLSFLIRGNRRLMYLSLMGAILIFYETVINVSKCTVETFFWIKLLQFRVEWLFIYDAFTSVMLLLVLIVSTLVHIYSVEYLRDDPFLVRFISYLSLFTFFMLMLVTAGGYIQLFLGWEGVGLSSYLLINFWFTRIQANKAALKAIILNRFGDVGLYIAIIILFFWFRTSNFTLIDCLISYPLHEGHEGIEFAKELNHDFDRSISLAGFCLLVGACAKSAQLGLHTWLPDAMEGPTPVSALIHAATMVTAGVFLLLRSSSILEYNTNLQLVILFIGAITAFFAGSVGCMQYDLKKVIAYSTCSQLGYMIFCIGLNNEYGSLFHLYTHGFFKALLFLGAGSIIHSLSDEQDIRRMGGLASLLPLTYIMMMIGSLSLMGWPGLSGFYSKDIILELGISVEHPFFLACYMLICSSVLFSSIYSIRLFYYVFYNYPGIIGNVKSIKESKGQIVRVLYRLTLLSLFIGFISRDYFIVEGIRTKYFSLKTATQSMDFLFNSEYIESFYKCIPLILVVGGIFWYLEITNNPWYGSLAYSEFYYFLTSKWYFDVLYNSLIVSPVMYIGYHLTFKLVDRGIIEYFGSMGLANYLSIFSFRALAYNSGYVYHYILLVLLGIVFFLFAIFLLQVSPMIFCLLCIILAFIFNF